jgi:DNA-binding NtrC family response regulator
MPVALVVDDDRDTLEAMQKLVRGAGFEVHVADSVLTARRRLSEVTPDVVLGDLVLPDGTFLDLLEHLAELPRVELVIVTGHATLDSAITAFRGGAADYLQKPIDVDRMKKILRHVRERCRLADEVENLRGELRQLGHFGKLVGRAPKMQAMYDLIAQGAPTDATVLITGETGTGKELVAETLHQLSTRAEGRFVPLNCGAVPRELIESELFGHEKGSFTGASRQRRGVFEVANGGTLFLDEITEMSVDLQVKLLRVLESHRFARVGSDREIEVNVRVVAATNRDPHEAVREGILREDLLYRLLVYPIELPPLRERPGDVEILANHFLDALNQKHEKDKVFAPEALERLATHTWPGNVRELRNAIERAFILSGDRIGTERLPVTNGTRPPVPAVVEAPAEAGLRVRAEVGMTIADVEKRLILATLHDVGERKTASELLGISVKTLYNRLKTYEEEGSLEE